MRELERRVVLSVIDRRWRDHLYEMDYLKDGIGLRAMAQRDPLVEYQREGFALFQHDDGRRSARSRSASCSTSRSRSTRLAGEVAAPAVAAKGLDRGHVPPRRCSYSAPTDDGGVEVRNQRGQLEQAATARAQTRRRSRRRSTTCSARTASRSTRAGAARRGRVRSGRRPRPAAGAPRGGASASSRARARPQNRAERRAPTAASSPWHPRTRAPTAGLGVRQDHSTDVVLLKRISAC